MRCIMSLEIVLLMFVVFCVVRVMDGVVMSFIMDMVVIFMDMFMVIMNMIVDLMNVLVDIRVVVMMRFEMFDVIVNVLVFFVCFFGVSDGAGVSRPFVYRVVDSVDMRVSQVNVVRMPVRVMGVVVPVSMMRMIMGVMDVTVPVMSMPMENMTML